MVRKINNIRIVTGCFVIFCCMLTASFVFAKDSDTVTKKSYYIERTAENDFVEKELSLVNKLEKKVVTEYSVKTYDMEIVEGNVIVTDKDTGKESSVYSKGDAKFLTEVNLYYYDTAYILIVTEDGNLYANVYKSVEDSIRFRKVDTDNNVDSIKVVEREKRFYQYPSVEVYGVNQEDDLELIKL